LSPLIPDHNSSPHPQTRCDEKAAQQARDRIVASGALGRSPVYSQLLDYLLDCSAQSRQPKEFDIAVDVLGRDSTFDVARDSVVRVYIHQLRNRLDKYYTQHEPDSDCRLVIPRGQYTITIVDHSASSSEPDDKAAEPQVPVRRRIHLVWAACVIVLLGANFWQWQHYQNNHAGTELTQVLAQAPWQAMMDDEIPVMIVMGDYYIFGELDEDGRIARMVRDFFINSREDLLSLFMQDAELQTYFRDLDMTYMPEGSASALLNIAPLVNAIGKRTQIKMMSRVTMADLRNNHIIYIGYISAMDKLNNLYFAASGLLPGQTYDELYERESGTVHTSTAGLPEKGEPFRDLALLATWPAAGGNQFMLVSGTRDAGLMHAASVLANPSILQELDVQTHRANGAPSFEALFEVYGIDRMNFDAGLIYQRGISPDKIWLRE
tara:strand:+ start:11103 stop:12407 length:1305 start_codon:yes stop_codon:yes gene_type:complete